jgi:hypothetical protein
LYLCWLKRKGADLKKTVKHAVQCNDSLIQIAGRRFLGVPTERCELLAGELVEVVDGPIMVSDHDHLQTIVIKIRHIDKKQVLHEGWILSSAID